MQVAYLNGKSQVHSRYSLKTVAGGHFLDELDPESFRLDSLDRFMAMYEWLTGNDRKWKLIGSTLISSLTS